MDVLVALTVSPVYLMMRSPGLSRLRYTWIVCHSCTLVVKGPMSAVRVLSDAHTYTGATPSTHSLSAGQPSSTSDDSGNPVVSPRSPGINRSMYFRHLRSASASVSCEQICAGVLARIQFWHVGSRGSGLVNVMLLITSALGS